MSTALLLDASFLCYRAYYTTGNLASGREPTGIPYGFFWSILQLAERFQTNRVVICWDSRMSKRKAIFPDYKKSRHEDQTAEELAEKMEIHKQMVKTLELLSTVGFRNQSRFDGYEADDIMAQAVDDNPDQHFIGIAVDNDLFQILSRKNFRLFNPITNKLWTASRFFAEYRVHPDEWPMVKAIAGCPTDGVPGVKGVAWRTAVKFLNDEMKPGSKKGSDIISREGLRLIQRNYKLCRLPFAGTPPVKLVEDNLNVSELLIVFSKLDFASFLTDEMVARWEQFCEGYGK